MTLTGRVLVTCPRGLEEVLRNEISSISGNKSTVVSGGVTLNSDTHTVYKLNLLTRTSMHVLLELFSFKAKDMKELTRKINSYSWHEIIAINDTFSVRCKVNSRIFNKSNILTLKIKDSIVDRIRKEKLRRPHVDKSKPTYPIVVNIHNNTVSIYLDSSGSPLSVRGYRGRVHRAAINPSLAAGLVYLSNWDGNSNFYDLMCGSGTIPIEAMCISKSIPPRLLRSDYAFKKWKDFDTKAYKTISDKSIAKINKGKCVHIHASDNTMPNIMLLKKSLSILKMSGAIDMAVSDISDIKVKPDGGFIIMNPPHGHRMSQARSLEGLYRKIGDKLKNDFAGYEAFIFCMNNSLPKSIGLRSKRRYILRSGRLDCRLIHFPLQKGKYH